MKAKEVSIMKKNSTRIFLVIQSIAKFLLKILKNPKGRIGVILVGIVVLAAVFAHILRLMNWMRII